MLGGPKRTPTPASTIEQAIPHCKIAGPFMPASPDPPGSCTGEQHSRVWGNDREQSFHASGHDTAEHEKEAVRMANDTI